MRSIEAAELFMRPVLAEGIDDSVEVEYSEEDEIELLESGEDAAESLWSAEEPFHLVAPLVKFAVVRPSHSQESSRSDLGGATGIMPGMGSRSSKSARPSGAVCALPGDSAQTAAVRASAAGYESWRSISWRPIRCGICRGPVKRLFYRACSIGKIVVEVDSDASPGCAPMASMLASMLTVQPPSAKAETRCGAVASIPTERRLVAPSMAAVSARNAGALLFNSQHGILSMTAPSGASCVCK